MANLIARIAVLLVPSPPMQTMRSNSAPFSAWMLMNALYFAAPALLLFLAAINVTSFFSLKDNRIVVVMILTVYFLLYAGAKELLRRRAEKKRK